jgi:hypothetical protein
MRHGHHHRRGFGPYGFRRGRFNREELLGRLEQYQRDLEQETADVADLIRRLREEQPAQPATTEV